MPLKLRNSAETPPGYFRFPMHPESWKPSDDPQKSLLFGGDIDDLTKKVLEFRITNGLQLGNIEEEIHDWLCRNTGARCRPAPPKDPLGWLRAKGDEIARFLKAMSIWAVNGGYVEQEEAEKRAETCASCRYNVLQDDSICFGCFGYLARVMQIIGNRTTRMNDSLKFCGICGCSNSVSVFVPLDVLGRAHRNLDFPDDIGQVDADGKPVPCWKKVGVKE